ncbi:MAG: NAD-dependent epimerase/dehydratase family protein [Alphaproteobacteria bacterium]|nr:NAD-dependent epimerase/dehydratase family protein [Alphaproteobacteria bacterium]
MSERRHIQGVLVTGATTPFGERFVRRMLADPTVGCVVAVAREPRSQAALPFHEHPERLVYCSVDLGHSRRAHELLFGPARDRGVEVVVHTALHRSALDRGKRVHATNVQALRTLLELGERHPSIRRFVFKSYGEVYQIQHNLPFMVSEDHPLNMAPGAPQWIRDRVEADLTACARMGLAELEIVVLRCAEVLGPGTGSQLFDYLDAPVCLRPAGYDPMMNLLSIEDTVQALDIAARAFGVLGVFNIPGADTLPLSECIRLWGRVGIPTPGSLMAPIYRARRRLRGHDFSYGMNRRRFHFGSVLDGTRARQVLGYLPENPIDWPAAEAAR